MYDPVEYHLSHGVLEAWNRWSRPPLQHLAASPPFASGHVTSPPARVTDAHPTCSPQRQGHRPAQRALRHVHPGGGQARAEGGQGQAGQRALAQHGLEERARARHVVQHALRTEAHTRATHAQQQQQQQQQQHQRASHLPLPASPWTAGDEQSTCARAPSRSPLSPSCDACTRVQARARARGRWASRERARAAETLIRVHVVCYTQELFALRSVRACAMYIQIDSRRCDANNI